VYIFSGYIGGPAISCVQFRTNSTQPTKVGVCNFEQQIKALILFQLIPHNGCCQAVTELNLLRIGPISGICEICSKAVDYFKVNFQGRLHQGVH
jgi:hypothetical protein